jgi:hypothetical protein
MPDNTKNELLEAGQSQKVSAKSRSRTTSRVFWITIIVLACVTVILGLISNIRAPKEASVSAKITPDIPPQRYEIPPTAIEKVFTSATKSAQAEISDRVGPILDTVYAPVYKAIPEYTSFHYSILGEYTELTQAAMGQMAQSMKKTLYSGFEDRIQEAGIQLDREYAIAYKSAIQTGIVEMIPANTPNIHLGPITLAAIQSRENRMEITLPLAAVTATAVVSGVMGKTIAIIAKKIAAKVAAKAAAKGLVKGSGILAGAGSGALLCSWSGPGAAACGVVGGLAAWIITDAVVINLDEYFNRDEFEADLRKLIDDDRAEKERLLLAALKRKSEELASASFTMNQLSEHDYAEQPAK